MITGTFRAYNNAIFNHLSLNFKFYIQTLKIFHGSNFGALGEIGYELVANSLEIFVGLLIIGNL